jgi:hypothetical protein
VWSNLHFCLLLLLFILLLPWTMLDDSVLISWRGRGVRVVERYKKTFCTLPWHLTSQPGFVSDSCECSVSRFRRTNHIMTESHVINPRYHLVFYPWGACSDMHHLTTGIRSEKCVVRRFRRCANVIECTYTNLLHRYAMWYSLLLLSYKPVQHVTVLDPVGNCNIMVL